MAQPLPTPLPPLIRRRSLVFVSLLITAAFFVLGFPDWDLDVLVWVALVPLFLVARGAGGWRGFFLGWLAGILLEGVGFRWILHSILTFTGFHGALAPVAFLMFCGWLLFSSLSWGLLGWLLGKSRTPGTIHCAVAVWVGVEHYFPRLFPWHLGGAFYEREWLRQGADLFGVSGLSYIVLIVNALVYLLIEWRAKRSRFPKVTLSLALLLLLAANIYGVARFNAIGEQMEMAPALKVGVLQPKAEPFIKGTRGPPDFSAREAFFRRLLAETVELTERHPLDLVVWPEGMYKRRRLDDPRAPESFDSVKVPVIVGGSSWGTAKWRNSAAYILPLADVSEGGRSEQKSRIQLYHKNIRLLFGERLPFEKHLPKWLSDRISVGTLEPGTECPTFTLLHRHSAKQPAPLSRFRILICYEVILPGYVRKNAGASDFLVNITEDIWYGDTAHIRQHESVLRMRCIENRVPIIRCTNVGPSGLVDAAGNFAQRTGSWVEDRKVVTLKPGSFTSPYRGGGFLFPLLVALGGVLFFVKYNFRNIYSSD